MERTKVETVYRVGDQIFEKFKEAEHYAFEVDCAKVGIEFFDSSLKKIRCTTSNMYNKPRFIKVDTCEGADFLQYVDKDAYWNRGIYPTKEGLFVYDELKKTYVLLRDKIASSDQSLEYLRSALEKLSDKE